MQLAKRSYLLLFTFIVSNISFVISQDYEPRQLLVQFEKGSNAELKIRKFQEVFQIKFEKVDFISDVMNVYQLTYPQNEINLDKEIRNWYRVHGIITVQKNHFIQSRETISNDPLFDDQWHLKNDGASGGKIDADIDATDTWDITTGGVTTHGDTIVVCIIENNGVDMAHPDLKNNHWKNYEEIPNDGIDNDKNGYIDDYQGWNVESKNDDIGKSSHGTKIAGLIGASGNNTLGVSGVNWDVKLMIIRGQYDEASVVEAYTYPLKMRRLYNETNGQDGAFVVATSLSWGIKNGDPAESPLWCAMYDTLGEAGILNIGATTNLNLNVDDAGDLPTTCTSDYLIGVTATDRADIRPGTGYGPISVDIAAPGKGMTSTTTGDAYGNVGTGTSYATPIVAGAVALAYSSPCADFINFAKYDPAAAALKMKHYMLSAVDKQPNLLSEVSSGGRLNAKNAIDSLINACDPNMCIPPFNIGHNSLTDTVIELTWKGFGSNYLIYLQEGNKTPVELPVLTSEFLKIDTLAPCTNYTITMKLDCGGGAISKFSYPYYFKTDGCCNNPKIKEESSTENILNLEWTNILYASSYDIRYRNIGNSIWNEIANTSSPLSISELSTCTEYEVQIKTICTDSTQGYGVSNMFRTKGCGICVEGDYCIVEGANAALEWIERVTINDFTRETGSNSGWYTDKRIATTLEPGETYNIELTPGYNGSSFTELFTVWIDFNYNGVFDSNERVVTNEPTKTTLITTITMPSNIDLGVTKMRIGMVAFNPPTSCPSGKFFGEYEDYCINIGDYNSINSLENEIKIYPNPFSSEFIVQFQNQQNRSVKIYDLMGKIIREQNTNADMLIINTERLKKGVYILKTSGEDQRIITKKITKQ